MEVKDAELPASLIAVPKSIWDPFFVCWVRKLAFRSLEDFMRTESGHTLQLEEFCEKIAIMQIIELLRKIAPEKSDPSRQIWCLTDQIMNFWSVSKFEIVAAWF